MTGLYARWIDRWETKLAGKDTNRKVRPFDWGANWLIQPSPNGDSPDVLARFVDGAIQASDDFYSAPPPQDFRLAGDHLTFTSGIRSPYPENDTVHGVWVPAPKGPRRAVVVLPQWNSDAGGHLGLCRLLNRFGVSALRMSMAYHDRRMPPELDRADYHVSANIGRTIHACRQSVVDVRACLTWLEQQGFERLGVLGTSLGSCMAFIAAAHDKRIQCSVFNHVSLYFSDVVWTGLSTQHVRKGIESQLSQEQLRRYWALISPASYLHRLSQRKLASLLVWAKYDTTFLPQFSRQAISSFRQLGLDHKVFTLPCAHYTTGRFPYNWMDGLAMCRFLSQRL